MTRAQLRKALRRQRRALDPDAREHAALAIIERIRHLREFYAARRIAFYLPNDGEIDTTPLIETAWRRRKAVYLPVLEPSKENRLLFAPYRPGDGLAANEFGIPEPDVHPRDLVSGRNLDLVLTPLVGFDTRGNRLGMGGGFYDRSFAYLRLRRHWLQPKLVGLAYELQRVDALDGQDWDVPLTAIVTETTIYRPTRASNR